MSEPSSLRLLSIPAATADRLSEAALGDAVGYFDPDGVVLPGGRNARGYAAAKAASGTVPTIHPQLGRNGEGVKRYRIGSEGLASVPDPTAGPAEPTLVAVQTGSVLAGLSSTLASEPAGTHGCGTYLFVPALSVETDTASLRADLPFADELGALAGALDAELTVLAGGQPAGYHHVWSLPTEESTVDVPVVGLGATGDGKPELTAVVCTPSGAAATEPIPADRFGLRALDGVGAATAEALAEIGCRSRSDVADTAASDLAALSGLGRKRAERLHAHADVIGTGEPLRLTNDPPVKSRNGRPPLCLDIETDGLSPTIIWQFGVYDPASDTHRAFTERTDPNDPGGVLGAFIEWLLGNHADRTILTWNGYGFDYPQIERFLRRYHPHYLDAWEELWTYDLYKWAVRDENALLPGRTNRLDDVAEALGYEPAKTGLSGAKTAAAYRRFMRRPDDPAAEPDWERHERYCRNDCEALYHVYRAIVDAERRDVTDSGAGGAAGKQSGLTDF